MFNKKSRSERSFSVMLAEELLRAELKKLYGDEVKLFQCDIVATPPSLVKRDSVTISEPERESLAHDWMAGSVSERQVNIAAIAGPFERLYPENPPEDRRRKLRRVEAVCRVYTITTGSVQWKAHYLKFVVKNEYGQMVATSVTHYEAGRVDGGETRKSEVSENPCRDMSDSQTRANYPGIHRELHDGIDRHA